MKHLLLVALLAIAFTSCSKEEQIIPNQTTVEFAPESPVMSRVVVITTETTATVSGTLDPVILPGKFISVTNMSRYHVYVIINGQKQTLDPTDVNLDIRHSDIQGNAN